MSERNVKCLMVLRWAFVTSVRCRIKSWCMEYFLLFLCIFDLPSSPGSIPLKYHWRCFVVGFVSCRMCVFLGFPQDRSKPHKADLGKTLISKWGWWDQVFIYSPLPYVQHLVSVATQERILLAPIDDPVTETPIVVWKRTRRSSYCDV